MATSLSQSDREHIWEVMSEFFVDNEIDYDYEARRINKFSKDMLREIFFREVAPVCGPNFLTSVPPVWMGFDPAWVRDEINNLLSRRKRSIFCRINCEMNILFYRVRLKDVWREVDAALDRNPMSS